MSETHTQRTVRTPGRRTLAVGRRAIRTAVPCSCTWARRCGLASISVPVLVMHGRQDQFAPFGHGAWLAGHVPGAEARLYHHDGHLTLLANRSGEVHAWLAGHFLAKYF